jgi:hypothetical protein
MTLMELLSLQLRDVEITFEKCLAEDGRLNKKIKRQEKEETAKGKVTLGMADSREVQQLKQERPLIWQPCQQKNNNLGQFLLRLNAFTQVECDTELIDQLVISVPAVMLRALLDWYFHECCCEVERLEKWWGKFKTAMQNENLWEELEKTEGIFVRGVDKAFSSVKLQRHEYIKLASFGGMAVVSARGFSPKEMDVANMLPKVAKVKITTIVLLFHSVYRTVGSAANVNVV